MRRPTAKRRKRLRLKQKRAKRPKPKSMEVFRLDRPFLPPLAVEALGKDRDVEW